MDVASAAVALAFELVLLPWAGLSWRGFWRRTAAVWIAAPLAGLTIALYGRASGRVYAEWWLVEITDGSLHLAIVTVLRVLAIALACRGPVRDCRSRRSWRMRLAQLLHLPARFVLGALAAFRLLSLMSDDWRALELARRARGVADRQRLRRLAGLTFALFVLSIRRGSALATAMEARGFGGSTRRTWARASRFGGREWCLVAIGVVVAGVSVTVAVLTGQWVLLGQ